MLRFCSILVLLATVSGCASRVAPSLGAEGGDAAPDTTTIDDAAIDGASFDASSADAARETTSDGTASPPSVRRLPCVGRTGLASDLPHDQYGAIEAELVSIVRPGNYACPSDSTHLHLQIEVGTKRYDVAVNIDSTSGGSPLAIATKDLAATTAAPGFAPSTFDFPTNLGLHSTDFAPLDKSALLARLETELASVSKVSIHGLTYTDGTGIHEIHRNSGGRDGVILAHGLGAGGGDHAIALRFSTDVF